MSLGSATAIEIAAGSGLDWVLIDTEHAPNVLNQVLDQVRAATGRGASVVVRPPANDTIAIRQLIDMGVQTVLIPFVNCASEAASAVAATRFAPRGTRGFSASIRANDYGRIAGYHDVCEYDLCVIVQVETRPALEALREIASVDGVDALFFGAADLSKDLGYGGNVSDPRVWDAIRKAIATLEEPRPPLGILVSAPADMRRAVDAGFTFVGVGSDVRLLVNGCSQLADQWCSHPRAS